MKVEQIPIYEKMKMSDCCGCEACSTVCPKNIIAFEEGEDGFRYPFADSGKCIHCNACVRVCPVLNKADHTVIQRECYGGYAKDEALVVSSSSGGIFSLLVKRFKELYPDGKFVGVVWGENFRNTEYYITDNIEDLKLMRVSKYVQARKADIYRKVKDTIINKKRVLFTGCPCEVAALKSYLGKLKESEYLYTVDFVCKGPISERVMHEYLDKICGKNEIKSINMRVVGKQPWIPQWIRIEYGKNKKVFMPFYSTPLGIAFQIIQRRSCYQCPFCGKGRYSDITLGDFHGADPTRRYYNANGTSAIVVNTIRGQSMLHEIMDRCVLEQVTYDELSKPNPCIEYPVKMDSRRAHFSENLHKFGLIGAWKREIPWMRRFKDRVKDLLFRVGHRRDT